MLLFSLAVHKRWAARQLINDFASATKCIFTQVRRIVIVDARHLEGTSIVGYCDIQMLWQIAYCDSFNIQILIQKYCKVLNIVTSLIVNVTLLPFPNSVTISDYHCVIIKSQGKKMPPPLPIGHDSNFQVAVTWNDLTIIWIRFAICPTLENFLVVSVSKNKKCSNSFSLLRPQIRIFLLNLALDWHFPPLEHI